MIFTVEGEPRGKQRPRLTRSGIVYTPSETTRYEKSVKAAYLMAGGRKINGPVKVTVWAFLKIPASKSAKARAQMRGEPATKKPDIDNILKIILDGLNGAAYEDDKQVVEAVVYKGYRPEPSVSVDVEAVI